MRWLALCALAAAAAGADLQFDRGALEVLPGLDQPTRGKAYRALATTDRERRQVENRVKQIEAALKKKPAAEQAKQLRTELARLRRMPVELRARYAERLKEAGLTDDHIERLKRMPAGPLRHERYNRGVVLEAPGLTERQRRVLEPLVAAADAAQLALVTHREQLKRDLKDADRIVRQQVESRSNQQIRETEKRFWRIAYYTLTADQMRAVRKLFSPRLQAIPQLRDQMMMIPDLDPSQANRLNALFTEHESELAADQAEARRCRAEMRAKDLAGPDRQALQARLGAAYRRMGKVNADFLERLRALLTQEQKDALNSAPPNLNVGERGRPPFEIVRNMRLAGEQAAAIRKLQQELGRERREIQKKSRAETGDMAGMFGPESPQQMTMMVAYRGAQRRVNDVLHRLGRTMVLEILEPGQLRTWMTTIG